MNRNFAVKILLILAIVLQSFNAVSALLDAHQVDAQHLETVHDHASDTKSVIEDQVTDEIAKKGEGDLEKLIYGANTWTVQ